MTWSGCINMWMRSLPVSRKNAAPAIEKEMWNLWMRPVSRSF